MTSLDEQFTRRQDLEARLIRVWASWPKDKIIRTLTKQLNVDKLQRLVDHQEGVV